MVRGWWFGVAAYVLSVLIAPAAHAQSIVSVAPIEFVVFFSAEDRFATPGGSHTFATFIRYHPDGASETRTISWMTNRLADFRLFGGRVQGRNWGLHETVQVYFARNANGLAPRTPLSFRGPFRVRHGTFEAADRLIEDLELGRYAYRARARGVWMGPGELNCFSAVTQVGRYLGGPTADFPRLARGDGATQEAVEYYAPLILDGPRGSEAHPWERWIFDRLRLNRAAFERKW